MPSGVFYGTAHTSGTIQPISLHHSLCATNIASQGACGFYQRFGVYLTNQHEVAEIANVSMWCCAGNVPLELQEPIAVPGAPAILLDALKLYLAPTCKSQAVLGVQLMILILCLLFDVCTR